MTEWDLMRELAKAGNTNDHEKLSNIILNNDFVDKCQAITIAISSFEVTKENISKNMEAAKKLTLLPQPKSFRESLRQELIKEIIDELES